MIPCGSVLLDPEKVDLLIPLVRASTIGDPCDPPTDLDQLPSPSTNPILVACLNAVYFDFLVCIGNADSCEEERECRSGYESAHHACIQLYGN